MNTLDLSTPVPAAMVARFDHSKPLSSPHLRMALAVPVAAIALWVSAPQPSHALSGSQATDLAKEFVSVAGNASKTAAKITKVLDLVDKLQKAKNPCPCARDMVYGLYRDSRSVTGTEGNFANAVVKCFGSIANLTKAQLTLEVDKKLSKVNPTKLKRALRSVAFALIKRCPPPKPKGRKKNKIGQQAFLYTPVDPGREATLLAGLEGYALPGSVPLAAGDLDGDGASDIAVCDPEEDTVSVMLSNLDGSFEVGETMFTGTRPGFVYVDDVDRDGLNDVVVLNVGSGDGSLFLGNGDGTFQDEISFVSTEGGLGEVETEVDGDDSADRVSVTENPGHVSVSLGALDGLYDTFLDYPTGGSADAVLPLDVDLDGVGDLLVHNQGSSAVAVLPGNGDGSFQDPMVFTYDEAGNLVEPSAENGTGGDQTEINLGSFTLLNTSGVTFVPAPTLVKPAQVIDRSTLTIQAPPSPLLGQ